jgi:DNA-binding transcriptional regulator WhiA
LAYLVGLALGDGNLSNPNGRATRLRITCDAKYPALIKRIETLLSEIFPKNKIGKIKRKDSCVDISVYSNKLEELLGWEVKLGSKIKQKVSIPDWIKNDPKLIKPCLRGLVETDGSAYNDRNYLMVNFVTVIEKLAQDFSQLVKNLGYICNIQTNQPKIGLTKYTIRISRKSNQFLQDICFDKS